MKIDGEHLQSIWYDSESDTVKIIDQTLLPHEFKVVDLMITNFHLPKSSLLMLVSAFIGHQEMHQIYQTAVKEHYRFLSYGDAMLLTKK